MPTIISEGGIISRRSVLHFWENGYEVVRWHEM